MRKAAGIILIILGMLVLVRMIIDEIGMCDLVWFIIFGVFPYGIVFGGLLVAGGVFCFRRRYWGLCLVSALVPLCIWIIPVVAWLLTGDFFIMWMWPSWILVLGTLISTIFISLTKKEWQEISD